MTGTCRRTAGKTLLIYWKRPSLWHVRVDGLVKRDVSVPFILNDTADNSTSSNSRPPPALRLLPSFSSSTSRSIYSFHSGSTVIRISFLLKREKRFVTAILKAAHSPRLLSEILFHYLQVYSSSGTEHWENEKTRSLRTCMIDTCILRLSSLVLERLVFKVESFLPFSRLVLFFINTKSKA